MDNANTRSLEINLAFTIDDYAHKRPHAALRGLTPFEAYSGKHPDQISYIEQLKEARKIRIEANRKYNCGSCSF